MNELLGGAGTALWLGILTSISPCPLATNLAAVSYIGRQISSAKGALWTSLLYAAGRMAAYVGLGIVLVYSLLSAPLVSQALQKYMIRIIGPALIVTGLLLSGWVPLKWGGISIGERTQARAARSGWFGGSILGFLFALAFCPVSAALFFGGLLPVALEVRSPLLLPSVYGLGTALPVIVVGFSLAAGAGQIGRLFDRARLWERWARGITAVVFLGVGLWFTFKYTLPFLWR